MNDPRSETPHWMPDARRRRTGDGRQKMEVGIVDFFVGDEKA